jgi:hypothetical protein
LIETANRLARDLFEQETGYQYLKRPGISLIAVDDPDSFTGDTPTSNLIRQILGPVAEFEKANLVAKLEGSREGDGCTLRGPQTSTRSRQEARWRATLDRYQSAGCSEPVSRCRSLRAIGQGLLGQFDKGYGQINQTRQA